jgi:hypothetical protein
MSGRGLPPLVGDIFSGFWLELLLSFLLWVVPPLAAIQHKILVTHLINKT